MHVDISEGINNNPRLFGMITLARHLERIKSIENKVRSSIFLSYLSFMIINNSASFQCFNSFTRRWFNSAPLYKSSIGDLNGEKLDVFQTKQRLSLKSFGRGGFKYSKYRQERKRLNENYRKGG